MTGDISITDIPHIVERFGLYLDRRDRMSCSLVSRSFRVEFNRIVWRQLNFPRYIPSSYETDVDDVYPKEALRYNLQLTRKVSIDTQSRSGVLPLIAESCTLLRDLNVIVSRNGQADPEGVLFSPAIDLISRNTLLRICSIVVFSDLSTNSLGRLARTLSYSPCLTELVLVFRGGSLPRNWFRCLLQNLPNPLKSLSLLWTMLDEDVSRSFPDQDWPESYPCLQVIKLMVDLNYRDESAFFQFLERCPALKDCSFPKMATMEAVNELTRTLGTARFPFTLTRIDSHMWGDMSETQWGHLLLAVKDSIQSFVAGMNFTTPSTQLFVPAMTRHWSQTLESLSIYHSHLISSQDIQLILTTCPKLKKFDCLCFWLLLASHPERDESNALPGLKAMVKSENGDNIDMGDWVCTELEELKLMFADGRRESDDESVRSQQEQWTVKGIRRAYQLLGRLTKLRKLTIGWCSAFMFSESANLDMTLESGLEYMKDLKSLSVLDLNFIMGVNIGIPEAEWMLKNWPSLTRIEGMRHASKEKDSDHFALLGNLIAEEQRRLSKLANLSLDWAGDVEEPQWLDIVMAMKGRIKSFATDVGFDTSPPTLIPLMVQLVLKYNRKRSQPDSHNLLKPEGSGLHVDWIHLEDTARSMQLSRARERIEHMYRQLGRLTKLRELTLGWNTMDPSSDAINLNMTLQQGLGHLAGLTTLRVLDVAHLPRVKIGLEEVKWMAGNWKMLRKIHGLRYRHRTPRRNATVPSYVRWLLSNRPCISIS
ncbi:hypothetical protein B0O80DRAFT_485225 [Mortierella sp. GBAus27b]|nr:hypothetical protein B0O80DRAFT_485225 [Mortierella sp. GBAus27b]